MASTGKQRTTMAKLAREGQLRERRALKQAKKDARKLATADGGDSHQEWPVSASTDADANTADRPTDEVLAQAPEGA